MSKTILMLEPDEDDRYYTKSIFDENLYEVRLDFVTSSTEFFEKLHSCEMQHKSFPSLILLNYYAVPQNAMDIIRKLKSNSAYKHIPTIVLSGTMTESIVEECYAAGANSFIQKPSLTSESQHKIGTFIEYWFKTVELPG